MRGMLRALNGAANRHAGKLFLVGLAGVCWYNWRQWQRDRARLAALGEPEPLPPLEEWPALPRVSALVAAWNEADLIEAHIESFLGLRYPGKELVLCAGGEDGTYELAQRYAGPGVIVLEQRPGEGKQAAVRRCLTQASGEVIYLTDADCVVDDESFERTLKPIVWDAEVAATGRFAPLEGQRRKPFVAMQWFVDNYARADSPAYIEGLIGRNAALSRRLLERLGGFSDPVPIGTDYYLARQVVEAGAAIRYVHRSEIQTRYEGSVRPYLRQQRRWLRTILLHGRVFGASEQVRGTLAQCLVGAGMAAWPLASLAGPARRILPWLLAVWHGVLSRFRYIRFGEISQRQRRQRRTYLLVPVYLLLDQFMLASALVGWLLPSGRWQW